MSCEQIAPRRRTEPDSHECAGGGDEPVGHDGDPGLRGSENNTRQAGNLLAGKAELGPDQTLADDTQVGAGEAVSYAVVAFDDDGLESLPADPVAVVSEDYGLVAEVNEGAVYLYWEARPDEGFDAARVYRAGLLGLQEIARVPSEGFVDHDVQSGRSYRYVVTLERDNGPAAPPSTPVEVRVPADSEDEPDARLGSR